MPGPKSEVSPLPTRERQRKDTRNLILEIASAEIAELGLSQVRIEHIAKKAGVTRPTIYSHFPTKEDFLRELESRTQERALLGLKKRLREASGATLVHRLTDAVFDLLDAEKPRLRREVFSLLLREPEKADWSENPLFGFLSDHFKEAQAQGEVPSAVTPPELTRIVMTSLFGFLAVEAEPAKTRRKAAHQMLDLLIGPTSD